MSEQFEPSLEDVLEEINKVAERMKQAKMTNDKVGYEIALKEYERLNEKYAHILYKKRDPADVYARRA